MNELLINNSVVFQLTLTNSFQDPIYVNDASVTVKVVDRNGNDVLASVAVPYVSSSNGIYRLTVPPISGLEENKKYTIIFDSVGIDSLVGQFICKKIAILSSEEC